MNNLFRLEFCKFSLTVLWWTLNNFTIQLRGSIVNKFSNYIYWIADKFLFNILWQTIWFQFKLLFLYRKYMESIIFLEILFMLTIINRKVFTIIVVQEWPNLFYGSCNLLFVLKILLVLILKKHIPGFTIDFWFLLSNSGYHS